MSKKTKLELTWIGKDERPKLEPRILIEDPGKSYHAEVRHSDSDIFDNMLIHGDNLLSLKALESEFAGKVKCVFIDPPYNTGSAFEHYDDGLEHSIWLSMMRDRLEIIKKLLSRDGSLWITVDDNEAHYLKVLCDEVFGRPHFVANAIWQKRFSPNSTAQYLSDSHDHILVYRMPDWKVNLLARNEKTDSTYKNPDNDHRGVWTSSDLSARNYYSLGSYSVIAPSGRVIEGPPPGRYWTISKDKFLEFEAENRIWWGAKGDNQPRLKRFLSDVRSGVVPQTVWSFDEVGHTQEAKKEAVAFNGSDVFSTPKPERLIQRIMQLATEPGDLVLDSFAGSGTTGAVAHKMNRRWIMIELGDHCDTHIIPRMRKVIDGEDKGGITEAASWNGGGGFRYFELAPSMLQQDKYGNWVISKEYKPEMLAEAMCKHQGFTYAPSQHADEYWSHGYSTEKDFIYVTTQQLTHDACRKISEDVGPERSLLVCCKAFNADPDKFDNLTLVKIPSSILTKCEWGRDDYSLNIANLPIADQESDNEADENATAPVKRGRKSKASPDAEPSLFDTPGTAEE